MRLIWLHSTVLILIFLQVPTAAPQALDAATEQDAYAIYAALLPQLWERAAKEMRPMVGLAGFDVHPVMIP